MSDIRADLGEEQDDLDRVVAELSPEQWRLATPSPRWSVADQIAHLTYFDEAAALAITDPDRFAAEARKLWSHAADGDEAVDELTLGPYRRLAPDELLAAWRAGRADLDAAAATLADDDRVPWYGPSMGAKSFLTARLMETWAHGIDIRDAIAVPPPATARLAHIARLGFITRAWSYVNRGLEPPDDPVRVELTAPTGESWEFGPADAVETVRGPALDFCLVVTQRRHLADTALEVTDLARDWLERAQAFAGPPTDAPAPGSRR